MGNDKKKFGIIIWIIIGVVVVAGVIVGIFMIKKVNTKGDTISLESIEGKKAYDFTLKNVFEDDVSLNDLKGSVAILAFVFNDKAAHNVEKYRSQLKIDIQDKVYKFLKVTSVNKPIFITKEFIISKLKGFGYSDEVLRNTVINWGSTYEFSKKYAIKDKKVPTFYIIGKDSEIFYSMSGMFNDENYNALKDRLNIILSAASVKPEDVIHIGVSQILYHPAIELSKRGFETALEEAGYIKNLSVLYDDQNANGHMATMEEIATKFINDKVDLVHSLTIEGTKEIVKFIKDIPVVFSMVTTPVEQGVIPSMDEPSGTNVTGVAVHFCPLMDLWPVSDQLDMYAKIIPSAKKWGTIYTVKDLNMEYHVKEMREECEYLDLELAEASIKNEKGIDKAIKTLVDGGVDAIYIIPDKNVMKNFDKIVEACNKNKIPLFGTEIESVKNGACVVYNQDYRLTGYMAGQHAVKILNGEAPGTIPSEIMKRKYLVINLDNAKKQGIEIAEEYKKMADRLL